ncbi:hypothetical protein OPV22_032594 [Ensete ventricosum]|uniref:Uncharacterized protein n=1 Tax=Ensete ventricosum TaxID=4639 RepID=A0AAV8PRX0_ENSVE|nr:hypothetical protein OPV22_032594 [Ensete ventricosum]
MWLRARVRRQPAALPLGCRLPPPEGADTRASGAPICLSGGFSRPGNREIPASPDLDPPLSSLLAEDFFKCRGSYTNREAFCPYPKPGIFAADVVARSA